MHVLGVQKFYVWIYLSNQMFEAYDPSVNNTPATLSESTMAYSKEYWLKQKWDTNSQYAECLPFIIDRYDTICTGPSSIYSNSIYVMEIIQYKDE